MPAERPAKISDTQIVAAKATLDSARRLGDPLRIELAESALNDLLDRYSYHGYHSSQRESK